MAEPDLTRKISTHDYFGNSCGGFGGTLECMHVDWETGQRCGRSPFEHGYVGKHRKDD